jgi:hypothetical protein
MKRKTKQKAKRETKRTETPVKGNLKALSEYFGSYLSALEVVSARQ